jgi:hypothetical protein
LPSAPYAAAGCCLWGHRLASQGVVPASRHAGTLGER